MRLSKITYYFLFFAFFTSFAVINVPSAKWGLQMSWALGLFMLLFSPLQLGYRVKISNIRNFKLISVFFFILIINSLMSWYLQVKGLIHFEKLDREELFSRSMPHCIYLLFEYLIYLYLVCFISIKSHQESAIKWFIVYPFYLITFYGIYQWLTTFDILPYTDIFNNNLSTGFTYLRFKGAHRSCSIFPEPSEYAYYLGFMLPFLLTPYYNKIKEPAPIFFKKKKFALLLYVVAVLSAGSMSLFGVLPVILFITIKNYIKISPKKLTIIFSLGVFILLLIIFLQRDRLFEMFAGDDGSTLTRARAFEDTLNLFLGSPIIGGGFGAVRGLDLLSFMLGTTGIVGTTYFCYLLFKINAQTYINKIFKTGFWCMIIVALLSNPIIDHTFFWPILAFNTVQFNNL